MVCYSRAVYNQYQNHVPRSLNQTGLRVLQTDQLLEPEEQEEC